MRLNKKALKILRIAVILGVWTLLIVAGTTYYKLYQYDKANPTKEYEWQSWETPPIEYQVKATLYNEAMRYIHFGLVLVIIHEFICYFIDPEKHWYKYFKKIAEKQKLEDDMGEEELFNKEETKNGILEKEK